MQTGATRNKLLTVTYLLASVSVALSKHLTVHYEVTVQSEPLAHVETSSCTDTVHPVCITGAAMCDVTRKACECRPHLTADLVSQ